MANWTASNMPSQKGKRAIVTGVGGLGFETALALTRAGAEVIMAGRNDRKGASAVRKVNANCLSADVRFEVLDLANLDSIKDFAARMGDAPVDILINNAGVMAPPQRQETKDGFELQIGTNHLGHFALTGRLLPALRSAKAARVVSVSSIAATRGKIDFDDLQSEKSYRPGSAYGQSKFANLLFATELQRRSDANNWKLVSCGAHPGIALTDLAENGPGQKSFGGFVMRSLGQSAEAGALPILYAATSDEAANGGYFGPDGFLGMKGSPAPAKIPAAALIVEDARRLWEESEKLTKVSYPSA